MKKILWLLIFLFNCLLLNAQKFSVNGKVADFEKKPVENATVYLLKQKDSAVINYSTTDKEGKFSLKTNEINEPSVLKIDADKLIPYSKIFDKINQSIELGSIELDKSKVTDIEEVKITVSPVKIKKDTIEFNAAAIKVRPDSNIDELLKNINGVEIDNDGKITVNGKSVDQIMINGKPFFDKEGKIALKNIPAEIIKNIQFTPTKTKEEEFTGKTPKSENTTINFTIDEKKNKGLLSRVKVGYGSDKRYDGSAFLNYFKEKTSISLIASSNNINSQGGSDDDSDSSRRNSSGGTPMNGLQKSTTVGVNYRDQLSKEIDIESLGLTRTHTNLETASKILKTTFLSDYNLKTQSENQGENDTEQYNFNTSLKIKPDTLSVIYFSPSFSHAKTTNFRNSKSINFRDDLLLNESQSSAQSEAESNNFGSFLHYSRKFRKKGRFFDTNLNTSISENNNKSLTNSQTLFYIEDGTEDINKRDLRNQLSRTKSQSSNYFFSTKYTEPISDSLNISFGVNYNSRSSVNERIVNDFDEITGQYSQYNLPLSNSSEEQNNQFSPQLNIELTKQKFNAWLNTNVDFIDLTYRSVFNGEHYELQRNFTLPDYNAGLQYRFSKTSRLNINNSGNFSIPSASRLIPYVDTSNPLITYTGNPDLKNSWINRTSVYFSNFNVPKNMNYYVSLVFSYNHNDTTNFSYYDDFGKQSVGYANISGNKTASISSGFGKTFKWGNNKLAINPRTSLNYRYNRGFIDGQMFTGNSYVFSPGINLTYDRKDKIIVKPSYSITYSFSDYENYRVQSIKNTYQTFRLDLTNYFLKTNLILENDFQYNTSSNIAPGFKRDFYFLNTGVGYSFYKKQFTARVKVYDILNQNQSVRRTISASYVEDREDLILKRYVMFSLTMKLNKFAGKKM
ncbi:Outer membrane protein beta-barrel family protein [Chryseobacterium arachidis]|uniref:Outer membrane protein beta-barrel family protein n=1 Tax=Chryseobacterium arachidis TaxID=1416778 RepID=A0A1M5F804_9FLAO|nr:TonB-dependent receptor [Chryseobacterium arachidis]SHF87518.1 Outer membrane protein beta-barrel family protein [Chryseobacterium arachidis]